MTRLTLVLVLVACGGKSTPATAPTAATADQCKAAAAKLVTTTTIADKDGLAAAYEARCQKDAWSADSTSCLAEKGEAGPCVLSDEIKLGIEQERAATVEKATTANPPDTAD